MKRFIYRRASKTAAAAVGMDGGNPFGYAPRSSNDIQPRSERTVNADARSAKLEDLFHVSCKLHSVPAEGGISPKSWKNLLLIGHLLGRGLQASRCPPYSLLLI